MVDRDILAGQEEEKWGQKHGDASWRGTNCAGVYGQGEEKEEVISPARV